MSCKVCCSTRRAEIEAALLNMDPNSETNNLAAIAKAYNISENDLKVHILMHSPVGVKDTDFTEEHESIAKNARVREVQVLEQVANEYVVTLKNLGNRLNCIMATSSPEDLGFEKFVTKPIVDLYIGTGAEIRQTVRAMAEVDRLVNGPKDDGASGLSSLIEAIRES